MLEAIDFKQLIASGTCGGALTWKLYASGVLRIDGAGAMDSFSAGGAPWYDHRADIDSVVLCAGVSSVSGNAFQGCGNLKSFAVADGNAAYRSDASVLYGRSGALVRYPSGKAQTSYAVPSGTLRILEGAFEGCSSLVGVTLPGSLVAIDGDALGDLANLKGIRVAAGSQNFRSAGGALYNAGRTVLIRYPKDGPTSYALSDGATAIAGGAFVNCGNLTSLRIPASVTSVGAHAFAGCTALRTVNFAGTPTEWDSLKAAAGAGNGALNSADVRFDLSAFTVVTDSAQYSYTGGEIKPIVTVSRGGAVLENGIDYKVSFLNNKWLGKASVSVEGTGVQYVGSARTTFLIIPVSSKVTSINFPINSVAIGAGQAVTTLASLVRIEPDIADIKSITWSSSNASIARVDASNGTITGVRIGECSVVASADNNNVFNTITVSVVEKGKGVTGIRLNASKMTIFRGEYALPKVTLSPSNAQDKGIRWISADPSVADVVGGRLCGSAYGTVTLTAIASSGYTARCTITVAPKYGELALEQTALVLGAGERYALGYALAIDDEAAGLPDADPVTFSSTNSKVASVNPATGEIKAVKPGTATISARTASGASAACAVTVRKAPSILSVAAPRASIGAGESMTLAASFPSGMGGTVTWSLPAEQQTLASIDPVTGVLTAGPLPGSITPIVRAYNGKTAKAAVAIVPAPSFVAFSKSALTLLAGDKRALTSLLPAGSAGAVRFSSADPGVASVDENGVVIAGLSAGSTAIRVETYNGRFARCTVTVAAAPATIALRVDSATLAVGQTQQIQATIAPVDAPCTLAYASMNPKVATVSATGLVRGVKPGTATITVTAYNGVQQTIAITVIIPIQNILSSLRRIFSPLPVSLSA